MGHKGKKHSWENLRKRYINNCKMTKKQLNDEYNKVSNYRPEDWLRNQKKVDGF